MSRGRQSQDIEHWAILDGRAEYDTTEATVVEVLGHQPPKPDELRGWEGQDAVLCRFDPRRGRYVFVANVDQALEEAA